MRNKDLEKILFEIRTNLLDINNLLVTLLGGIFNFEIEDDEGGVDDESLTNLVKSPKLTKDPEVNLEDSRRNYIG